MTSTYLADFLALRDDAKIEMFGLDINVQVDADTDDAALEAIRKSVVTFSSDAMTEARGITLNTKATRI